MRTPEENRGCQFPSTLFEIGFPLAAGSPGLLAPELPGILVSPCPSRCSAEITGTLLCPVLPGLRGPRSEPHTGTASPLLTELPPSPQEPEGSHENTTTANLETASKGVSGWWRQPLRVLVKTWTCLDLFSRESQSLVLGKISASTSTSSGAGVHKF